MKTKKKIIVWSSIVLIVLLITLLMVGVMLLGKNTSTDQPVQGSDNHIHDFSNVEIIRQKTCNEDGITALACSCGEEQLNVTPATGHSFGDWQIDQAATCAAAGTRSQTCSVCGAVQSESIPQRIHDYTMTVAEDVNNIYRYTCTLCNDTFDMSAEQELDPYNARYISDCDEEYTFEIYCEKDEVYIREHLFITDAYYHNTKKQTNLDYKLNRGYNGRWTVSPMTPYAPGGIYIASRSGEVFFGDMTLRDMTFQIHREESKEFELSKDVKFLQKMENKKGGYYPYTLSYSEVSGSYWLGLKKTNGLKVGDILCVGDATCMEDVLAQEGDPDIFGRIAYIGYDAEKNDYCVELTAPDLAELFDTLNIYSTDAVLRENMEFVSQDDLSRQATQLLYQSDDFAKLVCAVQDTSITYLSSRGYTTTLSTIQDFFSSIKVDDEETQMPELGDDGIIRGKIVINGEIPVPITISSDPDSEQLGEIRFYFKATVSLDSLELLLSLDKQTVNVDGREQVVKAQIGTKQQITIDFTMGVEMQMDWSLSSKPYVHNTKTGTYHFATCKHVAAVKDTSVLEHLTSESFFEKMAEETILVKNECQTCQPVSCMLADSWVINTSTKTIHTPTCTHAKKLKAPVAEISDLPLGNLLMDGSGYQECLDCRPSNRTTNSFSEQVLQTMKSGDLSDNLNTFKDMAKQAGESPEASTLTLVKIPFTITGLDVIEMQLGVYFDFNLEATLEYNNKLQINSEFGIYLNDDGFKSYSNSKKQQLRNDLSLIGEVRVDVGLQAGIHIHIVGIEKYCYADLSARVGLYTELHGAMQYDFISDRFGYASAYFEAGLHVDLIGKARLIFIKIDETSFLPDEIKDIPFLRYGFDKIYYNFDKMPDEVLVDTIYYNLEDADLLNVKYFDMVEMKEGTDQLNILGIKGKYTVEFSLKNGKNCRVSDGYLLVNTPYQSFSDELIITIKGEDRWGKYRVGNTQYNIDSYTVPIRYDASKVDPEQNGIPAGGFEFNGHYYKVYTGTAATWEDAKRFCEDRDGYLAVISSAEENAALYQYLQDSNVNAAYFGLFRNEQDEWEWVNGEENTYFNWRSGEPNNHHNVEKYGELNDGAWNDNDFAENTTISFICEWETYEFIPEHTEDMSVEGRMNALVGYYQGWYTATQGITGGSIGVHRTNALLQDEKALAMYANLATECAKDANGNITTTYTVEDVRKIVEGHTEEYIAIYMFGPLRENPSVEDGLYTMSVTYNENTKTYEFYGKEWIQHNTYVFADVKDASLRGEALLGGIYGNGGLFGSYTKLGDLSLIRFTPSFEEESE